MKKLTLSLITCLIFLSPNVVMSETMDDLVKRGGLFYKKFSEVPFTGKVTGKEQGNYKNGKQEGDWVRYWDDGQLKRAINYKASKIDGLYETYHRNGRLMTRSNYKDGAPEGLWEVFFKDGQLSAKGNYKNGKPEGLYETYHRNGQLWEKKYYNLSQVKKNT